MTRTLFPRAHQTGVIVALSLSAIVPALADTADTAVGAALATSTLATPALSASALANATAALPALNYHRHIVSGGIHHFWGGSGAQSRRFWPQLASWQPRLIAGSSGHPNEPPMPPAQVQVLPSC